MRDFNESIDTTVVKIDKDALAQRLSEILPDEYYVDYTNNTGLTIYSPETQGNFNARLYDSGEINLYGRFGYDNIQFDITSDNLMDFVDPLIGFVNEIHQWEAMDDEEDDDEATVESLIESLNEESEDSEDLVLDATEELYDYLTKQKIRLSDDISEGHVIWEHPNDEDNFIDIYVDVDPNTKEKTYHISKREYKSLQQVAQDLKSLIKMRPDQRFPEEVPSLYHYAGGKVPNAYCSQIQQVVIDNNITSIDRIAFEHCAKLTNIIIPNNITEIGDYAFSNSGLTSVTIPGSVKSIGSGAFANCRDLTSVVICDGVTGIEDYAFSGCKNLMNIVIPSSVTNIDDFAFANCSKLEEVYYGGTQQQWEEIKIDESNDELLSAHIVFNSNESLDESKLYDVFYDYVKRIKNTISNSALTEIKDELKNDNRIDSDNKDVLNKMIRKATFALAGNESLNEDASKGDFSLRMYEVDIDDDSLGSIINPKTNGIDEIFYITEKDVINKVGKDFYEKAKERVSKETFDKDTYFRSYLFNTFTDKFHKKYPDIYFTDDANSLRLENPDILPTEEERLQKYLGKILLPPKHKMRSESLKESHLGYQTFAEFKKEHPEVDGYIKYWAEDSKGGFGKKGWSIYGKGPSVDDLLVVDYKIRDRAYEDGKIATLWLKEKEISESVENDKINTEQLAKKLTEYSKHQNPNWYFNWYAINDNQIECEIIWGDWKHDHLRADWQARDFLEEKWFDEGRDYIIKTETTEDDGSDTYSAIHTITFR